MPGGISFQGHTGAKQLSPERTAKVLVPLCKIDLGTPAPGKTMASRAWTALYDAGFRQHVPFIRGPSGEEEIVVVLPEGVASWPVRQLTLDAIDFLEVQAL